MIYKFTARSGEQAIPLEVKIDYKPGKQSQRARRFAVGELLVRLGGEQITIDASGEDLVQVNIDGEHWVIQ